MEVRYLELGDYLLIAEAVLEISADTLAASNRIDLADSAVNAPAAGFGEAEAYPEFEAKAAVLCWHLIKNHPLPDGNKRAAFLATIEFVNRNGRAWTRAAGDPAETDEILRGVASSEISREQLQEWIVERISEDADG